MDATFYRFGPFRLYPSEQLLLREQEPVALPPKAFEVLLALVASEGHLMTRDALMQLIWPRGFVEEINLTVNISLLRKLLGRLPDGSAYIVTVPKCGYRFQAPVTREAAAPDGAAAARGADAESTASPPLDAVDTARILAPVPPPSTPSVRVGARRGPHRITPWGLGAVAVLAIVALAGLPWWLARPPAARNADVVPIRTLAVLPFELISDEAHDPSLGLGMADVLITRLGNQGQLRIRPLGAVRRYVETRDPAAAGRELAVDAVLDGTIQHLAGQTRVSVRLIRVESGAILWTDTFDAPGATPFALEDSIARSLTAALALELDQGPQGD